MHPTTTPTSKCQQVLNWARGLGIALAGCLSLAACVAAPGPQTEAAGGERIAANLEALFDQYLTRDDLSDFEREVLERARQAGKITPEDYETAHAQEVACMKEAGYHDTYQKLPNGLYKITPNLPDTGDEKQDDALLEAYMDTDGRCSEGVSMIIEALYRIQQGNPELLADDDEVVAQCLRRSGLAPEDYNKEQFVSDFDDSFRSAPFDPNSDAAQACFAGAGMAIHVSEPGGQ